MKNILVVIGGGRANGNTMQLADSFIAGAKEAGHQVEKISLLKKLRAVWDVMPAGLENHAYRKMIFMK